MVFSQHKMTLHAHVRLVTPLYPAAFFWRFCALKSCWCDGGFSAWLCEIFLKISRSCSYAMSGRIYCGRLPSEAQEKDLETLLKSIGKIRDVDFREGFAYAVFKDSRDADRAVQELNGREFMGQSILVERAKEVRNGVGGYTVAGGYTARVRQPKPPPVRTNHRIRVENLPARAKWSELKEFMSVAGDVTFADTHRRRPGEGLVEFASKEDMIKALETLNKREFLGKKIRLVEETPRSNRGRSQSRSRSRSVSPRNRKRQSSSPSNSKKRRSQSSDRSISPEKSRKPRSNSLSPSHSSHRRSTHSESNHTSSSRRRRSHSKSPKRSRHKSRSRSHSNSPKRSNRKSTSKSHSKSPKRSHWKSRSGSHSKSPKRSQHKSRSRSQSKSPKRSHRKSRSRSLSKSPKRSKPKSRSESHSKSPKRSYHRSRSRSHSKAKGQTERHSSSKSHKRKKLKARLRSRSRSPKKHRS